MNPRALTGSIAALALVASLASCGSAQVPSERANATSAAAISPAPATPRDEERYAQPALASTPPTEQPSASPDQPSRGAGVNEPVTPQAPPPMPTAAPAAVQSTTPPRRFDVDATGGSGGVDPIASSEALIARNEAILAAAVGECRTICMAAGNVCTAAGELCRLAGDRDARCSRARSRCVDAGRRRDGACPVCPSSR